MQGLEVKILEITSRDNQSKSENPGKNHILKCFFAWDLPSHSKWLRCTWIYILLIWHESLRSEMLHSVSCSRFLILLQNPKVKSWLTARQIWKWAYLHCTILWCIFFMQVCQLSTGQKIISCLASLLFWSAFLAIMSKQCEAVV